MPCVHQNGISGWGTFLMVLTPQSMQHYSYTLSTSCRKDVLENDIINDVVQLEGNLLPNFELDAERMVE